MNGNKMNRPNNGCGNQMNRPNNGCGCGNQMNRPNNGCGNQMNRPNNGCGCGNQMNRPNNGCGNQMNRPNNGCGCGNQTNRPNNGCGNQMNRPNNGCGCGNQMNRPNNGCGCESVDFSQNLMNLCRDDLLKVINEVSFAMYDCCLFLDTHPMDSCALDYFQKMKKKRKAAMDIYTRKFGPLVLDCAGDGCTWDWGQEPLPWE